MFPVYYFSPLWFACGALLLNDYFAWFNALNCVSRETHALILALCVSVPIGSLYLYSMLNTYVEEKRSEQREKTRKATFATLQPIVRDKDVWESISKEICKITETAVQCVPSIVELKSGACAICVTYVIGDFKIGYDVVTQIFDAPEKEKHVENIIKCIRNPFFTLYEESGLRSGIESYDAFKK